MKWEILVLKRTLLFYGMKMSQSRPLNIGDMGNPTHLFPYFPGNVFNDAVYVFVGITGTLFLDKEHASIGNWIISVFIVFWVDGRRKTL